MTNAESATGFEADMTLAAYELAREAGGSPLGTPETALANADCILAATRTTGVRILRTADLTAKPATATA